jgi:hypothetical protein
LHGRAESVVRDGFFSYVPDYLGDGHVHVLEHWSVANASWFMDAVRESGDMRSLAWCAQHLDLDDHARRHARYDATYVRDMTDRLNSSSARRRKVL